MIPKIVIVKGFEDQIGKSFYFKVKVFLHPDVPGFTYMCTHYKPPTLNKWDGKIQLLMAELDIWSRHILDEFIARRAGLKIKKPGLAGWGAPTINHLYAAIPASAPSHPITEDFILDDDTFNWDPPEDEP